MPRGEPTHVYTGPTNKYGLFNGDKCWIVGKRAGGVVIKTERDGVPRVIGKQQLQKLQAKTHA